MTTPYCLSHKGDSDLFFCHDNLYPLIKKKKSLPLKPKWRGSTQTQYSTLTPPCKARRLSDSYFTGGRRGQEDKVSLMKGRIDFLIITIETPRTGSAPYLWKRRNLSPQ
ncbi:hypothetical protein CDAR_70741 [Caerostris darwini]|uniref:Uncharacterized protein n=1 Tax=Caerostris darwini TaxID=1538125 RepID=A0AAV4WGJ4_9ARAC|nr:hypothetical protein CDAR_70741 [Caerostris darwini]